MVFGEFGDLTRLGVEGSEIICVTFATPSCSFMGLAVDQGGGLIGIVILFSRGGSGCIVWRRGVSTKVSWWSLDKGIGLARRV